MDAAIIEAMHDATRGSDEGRMTFPAVLARLASAGVERYHADLCRGEKTYYLPDGDSHVESCRHGVDRAAEAFAADEVESAVRTIQRGEIGYQEFCRRVLAAGCVGYLVSLAGRRVVYYGRTGETHVEHFPSAKS